MKCKICGKKSRRNYFGIELCDRCYILERLQRSGTLPRGIKKKTIQRLKEDAERLWKFIQNA